MIRDGFSLNLRYLIIDALFPETRLLVSSLLFRFFSFSFFFFLFFFLQRKGKKDF